MSNVVRANALHLGALPNHHAGNPVSIVIDDVCFWYGAKQALKNISLDIYANEVTAFLGPSGCGKTTLLRCLNRTNEIIDGARMTGRILLDGADIHDPELEAPMLRRRFGWIAQQPNPFPRSIRSNILYGPKLQRLFAHRDEEDALVECSLRAAGLWDEVKDCLNKHGDDLSIGQQQRLCIARALAIEPEVLLMDEPCSALDPVSTARIENLIDELRERRTIIIVTHNLQQAARISQPTAFFHLGELLEAGDTRDIFLNPQNRRCRDFVTGRYG